MRIELSDSEVAAQDFSRDLRGYIAWSVAFYSGVSSSNKEAAIKLFYQAADSIIESVRADTAQEKPDG